MAISTWAATTGDWDDSKFSQPWDGPIITVDAGAATTSSSIPIASEGSIAYPAKGDTVLAGKVPIASEGKKISPSYTTTTLSTTAPSVEILRLYYVPTASPGLSLSGKENLAVTGHAAFPDSANMYFNPYEYQWDNYVGAWEDATLSWDQFVNTAPTVGQTRSPTPDVGTLVLAGQAPDAQHRAPKFIPSVQVI
jgi:hypothetical protein